MQTCSEMVLDDTIERAAAAYHGGLWKHMAALSRALARESMARAAVVVARARVVDTDVIESALDAYYPDRRLPTVDAAACGYREPMRAAATIIQQGVERRRGHGC